ncbi:MAG: type II toxin-antitoxin system RelE/ParE family toxin [Candidatus Competibacter sp.]|nr:type II toxin-antitoxin system RelE/ParE family toxin [Candidatus Competibacteraceae bacterium]
MSQEAQPRQVIVYAEESGKEPFKEGLYGLRDVDGRKRILARLSRLARGNFGDCASVGDGVSELRMFFGSGYRVYFGEHDGVVVVLLCGGDKSSRSRDIEQAKTYWKEYLSHEGL